MSARVLPHHRHAESEWLEATAPRQTARWAWRGYAASNKIAHIRDFTHRYFLMRHGESTANRLGILCGSEEGARHHPLTPQGEAQVAQGIASAMRDGLLPRGTHIVSSPHLRAYQSAVIAARTLGMEPDAIHSSVALVERDPGRLEGVSYRGRRLEEAQGYQRRGMVESLLFRSAFRKAIAAATRCGLGVDLIPRLRIESAVRVLERTTGLILSLEQSVRTPTTFLLVGHEDQIGILLTALTPFPPGRYWVNRHVPHGAVLPFTREYAVKRYLIDSE